MHQCSKNAKLGKTVESGGKATCIIQRLPTSSVLSPAMVIDGTVSQISYSGPSSRFMCFQKSCSHLFKNVSRFLASNKK